MTQASESQAEAALAPVRPERRRDPGRRERILEAAADLVAQRGYHGASLAEIGAAADIVGSGVYRHFDNKGAVLAALFDEVIDALSRHALETVERSDVPEAAMSALVDGHVAFALEQRRLLQVYNQEFPNLPDPDRSRLQRKQRLYLEEWVDALCGLRPELSDGEARVLVRAAIGAIHSVLFFTSGLPTEQVRDLLAASATSVLATDTSGRSAGD